MEPLVCSLGFTHSIYALVAAVVRRMLIARVTLGNIYCVLSNLTKRLIFATFKDSFFPPNVHAVNSHICLVSVMIYIFSSVEFIYGTFEDCISLFNSHNHSCFISESLIGNTLVTKAILQK